MITIPIREAGKLIDQLQGRIRDAALKGAVSAGYRMHGIIVNEIIPSVDPVPVDQGAYRAGWQVGHTKAGANVYNVAPHAPIIEWGARAENIKIGRAMILALAEWVVRKGLLGKQREGNKWVSRPGYVRPAGSIQDLALEQEAQRTAWAIAVAMKQRGIFNRGGNNGLGVLRKAKERAPSVLAEEVAAEIREEFGGR